MYEYWKYEEPEVVETTTAILKYYRKAGKLQVRRQWFERDGGMKENGTAPKIATLDRRDVAASREAKRMLKEFIADVEAEANS